MNDVVFVFVTIGGNEFGGRIAQKNPYSFCVAITQLSVYIRYGELSLIIAFPLSKQASIREIQPKQVLAPESPPWFSSVKQSSATFIRTILAIPLTILFHHALSHIGYEIVC